MVFVYQTGGKIPKEVIHNGLIYQHEWNASSMKEAKHIAKTRHSMFKDRKNYIKRIPYARETVYAVYLHLPTSDRILKGQRWEDAGGAPHKSDAVKMGMDIYGKGNYKVIKHPRGYYSVWRKARK